MKMHDLLIWALTQPDDKRHVPLYKIVGTSAIKYYIEPSVFLPAGDQPDYTADLPPQGITPDIIVQFEKKESPDIAIEVEADVDFDFGESLRQIKKYRKKYQVKVIILKECEKLVSLYKNEGFPVYLWSATRIWECKVCGNLTHDTRDVMLHCEKKHAGTKVQRLKDIMDVKFEEAT